MAITVGDRMRSISASRMAKSSRDSDGGGIYISGAAIGRHSARSSKGGQQNQKESRRSSGYMAEPSPPDNRG